MGSGHLSSFRGAANRFSFTFFLGRCMAVKIELYSTVRLKDGREGAVVEMDGPDHYLVDVGSSPENWETVSVPASEIVEVL